MKWRRWNIQHVASLGQRKKPRRELNPRTTKHQAGVLSIELGELMVSKAFLQGRVLHTARIDSVDSVLYSDKWRKIRSIKIKIKF